MGNLVSKKEDNASFNSTISSPTKSKQMNIEGFSFNQFDLFENVSLFNQSIESFANMKMWKFNESSDWYKVVKNGYRINMSQTSITLPTRKYSIAFMYTLQGTSPEWNNIFHISNSQQDWVSNAECDGCRMPAMWVIPETTNFHLRFSTDSDFNDGINTPDYQIRPINIGEKIMIVLTFDDDLFSMYYDGIKVFSKTFNNIHQIKPSATLYIGNPSHNNNGKINIKDFTIYDGVLLPGDIYNIYMNTKEGNLAKDVPKVEKSQKEQTGISNLKPDSNIDKSINRILTNSNGYAYCLGGTIKCNDGILNKINDDYTYGSTYNYKCSNGTQAYCSNGILESKKDINNFTFSNSYKGFTIETKDNKSPYVYDLNRNTITYTNNSYIASEDICNFLTKDSHSKNCYMPY